MNDGALSVALFTECYRPIRNGVVESVATQARSLRALGHRAIVITPRMPNFRDAAPDIIRLPSLPLPTRSAYRLTIPIFARRGIPLSIVHAHSPFVTGVLAIATARSRNVPLVFTYHTRLDAYAHYVPIDARVTQPIARAITRRFANACDLVIVPTRSVASSLRELGVRASIAIVPSGIDVARFATSGERDCVRARFNIPNDARVVLSVGRLGIEKNLRFLLTAFAHVRDERARLLIVGEGVQRRDLESQACRLGIAERTTFTGEISPGEIPALYAAADVFAFASRTETQGLVLVEALAAGLPIVAVTTPQTKEVLAGEGVLVPEDAHAFATALGTVLAVRPATDRGVALATRYDGGAVTATMVAHYAALLGRNS